MPRGVRKETVSMRIRALQGLRAERFKDMQRHLAAMEAEYQKIVKCKDEIETLDRTIKDVSERRGVPGESGPASSGPKSSESAAAPA